jgi:hypothetical protein
MPDFPAAFVQPYAASAFDPDRQQRVTVTLSATRNGRSA